MTIKDRTKLPSGVKKTVEGSINYHNPELTTKVTRYIPQYLNQWGREKVKTTAFPQGVQTKIKSGGSTKTGSIPDQYEYLTSREFTLDLKGYDGLYRVAIDTDTLYVLLEYKSTRSWEVLERLGTVNSDFSVTYCKKWDNLKSYVEQYTTRLIHHYSPRHAEIRVSKARQMVQYALEDRTARDAEITKANRQRSISLKLTNNLCRNLVRRGIKSPIKSVRDLAIEIWDTHTMFDSYTDETLDKFLRLYDAIRDKPCGHRIRLY